MKGGGVILINLIVRICPQNSKYIINIHVHRLIVIWRYEMDTIRNSLVERDIINVKTYWINIKDVSIFTRVPKKQKGNCNKYVVTP